MFLFIRKVGKFWRLWRLQTEVEAINWEMEVHMSNVIRVVSGWSKLDASGRERAISMMWSQWSKSRRIKKRALLRQMVELKRG